jgi:hypothetical protein
MEPIFPSANIDPRKKDKAWALQYCRAAWQSYSSGGWNSLYSNRNKYRELTDYALSKQSISRYKKIIKADESPDPSYSNMNWAPLAVLTKFRELALSITKRSDYDILATPIDPKSQGQIDRYFKEQEAKIRMREALKKVAPDMVEMSPVRQKESEPADLEELEVQRMYSFKHALATEMEQWMQQVFLMNNMDQVRAEVKRCLFDYGIGGIKEYVDKDGIIKLRAVNPANMICSRVTTRDFKDAEFIGEITEINIQDLAEMAGGELDDKDLGDIARKSVNGESAFTGINMWSRSNMRDSKVRVLDIEWLSYNSLAYEESVDKYGNIHLIRTSPGKGDKQKLVKVVYQAKWVMGTDYIFGFGLATNMKRKRSALQETSLSYHIFAPNFDYFDMSSVGKVEQSMNVVDQINLAYYRLQHVIAKARPKGIMIEIGALEDVPIGKGGQAFTAKDLIDIYESTGNIYYRLRDMEGNAANYRPITELEGGIGAQAQEYFNIIQQNIQLLRDVIGLNEVTDSFAGQRTYSAAVNAGIEATNNSLYGIIEADRELMQSVAESISLRIQTLARAKNINKTYLYSLGKPTLDFMKQGDLELSSVEFGISLDAIPTPEERMSFKMRLEKFIDSGQLDIDDAIMIEGLRSLKTANGILAYKVKKKRERAEQQAMMMQQQNAQIQQQSAMIAEEEKRKTLQLEYQLKMELLQAEVQKAMAVEQMRLEAEFVKNKMMADASLTNEQLRAESKEYIAETMASVRKAGRNPAQVASDTMK